MVLMRFPAGFLSLSHRGVSALSEDEDALTQNDNAIAPGRAAEARGALLDRIRDFIEQHDLPVTSANLATICGGLSGSHQELAQAFAAREIAGEPIDQRWLDTLARLDPDSQTRIAELDGLMDKLEYALLRFAQTARSAHTETSDQRGAIGAQLELMAAPGDLAQVLDLSRAMLARIEQVEMAMARSEAETASLRENLAKAKPPRV
jgi:diguanylate cyclase